MAEPPEVPDAPVPPNPDEQPARRGELRAVRRWLLVTAVWAVAATAIALIALLSQDDTAEKEAGNVAERVTRLERDLDRRLDALEEDISSVAKQEDVTKLAQRLSRVEDARSKTSDDISDARSRLDDLETRIEELEATADSGGSNAPGNSEKNPNR